MDGQLGVLTPVDVEAREVSASGVTQINLGQIILLSLLVQCGVLRLRRCTTPNLLFRGILHLREKGSSSTGEEG